MEVAWGCFDDMAYLWPFSPWPSCPNFLLHELNISHLTKQKNQSIKLQQIWCRSFLLYQQETKTIKTMHKANYRIEEDDKYLSFAKINKEWIRWSLVRPRYSKLHLHTKNNNNWKRSRWAKFLKHEVQNSNSLNKSFSIHRRQSFFLRFNGYSKYPIHTTCSRECFNQIQHQEAILWTQNIVPESLRRENKEEPKNVDWKSNTKKWSQWQWVLYQDKCITLISSGKVIISF